MPGSPPSATFSTFDLLDAFADEGCPICRLSLRSVTRFIDSMNYDSVNDPGFRAQLNAARGFCNPHAYQWLHTAFVLGTAEIYREVLHVITADVRRATFESRGIGPRLSAFLGGSGAPAHRSPISAPTVSCPACAHLQDTGTLLTRALVDGLQDADFRNRYASSRGLCLPHLGPALSAAESRDVFQFLQDFAVDQEETMLNQLGEIVRKHDYRYRDEVAGDERGAAERAVAHVHGALNALPVQII